MKKRILRLAVIWLILCIPQILGFRGPASAAILHNSRKWDPEDIRPLRAFSKDGQILLEYEVGSPQESFQMRLHDSYWASIPLDVVNSVRGGKWTIHRDPTSPVQDLALWRPLKILEMSDFQHPPKDSFINKDSLLTYIVDQNQIEVPVVILDRSAPAGFNFHLIGDRKLHDSYRGYWNLPRDQFTHTPSFWAQSWMLPFACILDYPATAFVFFFSPRW